MSHVHNPIILHTSLGQSMNSVSTAILKPCVSVMVVACCYLCQIRVIQGTNAAFPMGHTLSVCPQFASLMTVCVRDMKGHGLWHLRLPTGIGKYHRLHLAAVVRMDPGKKEKRKRKKSDVTETPTPTPPQTPQSSNLGEAEEEELDL